MFFGILKQIMRGKSLVRSLMNMHLRRFTLFGTVADIGGGTNPSYYQFISKQPDTIVTSIDGKHMAIDLETDALPVVSYTADFVLLFNVLEHIYHHKHVAAEAHRVLKPDGTFIGFVPFLVNYHPDPHDYFRYTPEALTAIFTVAGFHDVVVTPVGRGPFSVGYNTYMTLLPAPVAALLFPGYYILDTFVLKLKPALARRYPLGYLFTAQA